MYIKLFIGSDLIISRFWMVLNLSPMCPAIFFPLKTFPGSCLCPVDPCDLCETETPCVARKPLKLYLFITPAKPLPIVFDVTSTKFLSFSTSRPISFPSLKSATLSTLYSLRIFFASVAFFAKTPFIAFVNLDVFIFPKPIRTALYPRFSFVKISRTLPFSIFTTVTGTDIPESKNSLVIPSFFPIKPIVI